jgi:hypothetical protein
VKYSKIIVFSLLFLLVLGLFTNITPKGNAETVNLDSLLLEKFDEYMAWLTRHADLNGTGWDNYERNLRASGYEGKQVQGVLWSLLPLTYIGVETDNDFYINKARAFLDGLIANSMCYVTVGGVGEIFFPPAQYYDGAESNPGPQYVALVGIVATKLYLKTGVVAYKNLATRIAHESYDHLTAVNNSTDLSWSWQYYVAPRDEANAKAGVARQTYMAWFYALYGKNINSTFTPLVPKIINWVWRAQLASKGLAYDIGGSTSDDDYTATASTGALAACLEDPTQFSASLRTKIVDTLVYLRQKVILSNVYMRLEKVTAVFAFAWKSDYFVGNVSVSNTKAMIYSVLNGIHFTEKGWVSGLSEFSMGYRLAQIFGVIFAVYPLPDPSFDKSTYAGVYAIQKTTGIYYMAGYNLNPAVDFRICTGADYYGSKVALSSTTLLGFRGDLDMQDFTSASFPVNNSYYIKTISTLPSPTNVVTVHWYPTGVFVGDVSGSTYSQFMTENSALWRIQVANGTSYQFTGFTNGQTYKLSNELLVWKNGTNLWQQAAFYVKAPTDTWNYTFSTFPYLKFSTTKSNYRIIYTTYAFFGDALPNSTVAFNAWKSIVDAYDTTQPISYDTMFNTYHNELSTLLPDASWKNLYESTVASTPKLIGHNLPQTVSISSWTYTTNKLTFNISEMGTTKIYAGDLGNATDIYGETSWSYNATTKILTISGMGQIDVFWYPVNVYSTEVVVGGIVSVATGSLIFWWWRRRTKTRTVTVP